ncbi:hypothetical protein TNCV_799271 [Trichonephila clavipes]|nr:hypothetical protein TNCV_799271 [Trichonephila clavipes]
MCLIKDIPVSGLWIDGFGGTQNISYNVAYYKDDDVTSSNYGGLPPPFSQSYVSWRNEERIGLQLDLLSRGNHLREDFTHDAVIKVLFGDLVSEGYFG